MNFSNVRSKIAFHYRNQIDKFDSQSLMRVFYESLFNITLLSNYGSSLRFWHLHSGISRIRLIP